MLRQHRDVLRCLEKSDCSIDAMTEPAPFNFEDARMVPIPPQFYSLETDRPFGTCLRCSHPLLSGETPYMIERVFKRDEPIIEYAICLCCAGSANSELSSESLQAIRNWFQEHFDADARLERLCESNETDDAMPLFCECVITGQAASECDERQIMALCRGDQMMLGISSPIMLSGAAIEKLVKLLSEQTKGWLADFVGDNFGMSPEFCDNPDLLPLLI